MTKLNYWGKLEADVMMDLANFLKWTRPDDVREGTSLA
jgi:hypothetical protein